MFLRVCLGLIAIPLFFTSVQASEVIIFTLKRKAHTQVFNEQGIDKRSGVAGSSSKELHFPILPIDGRPWATDVKIITRFLLDLDHTTQWPHDHKPIDPLKLHKLLYYAHGYALAFYGKPLFTNDSITRWEKGPALPKLYPFFAGQKDPITPADVVSSKLSECDTSLLAPEQRNVLTVISHAKSAWSGSALVSATHTEEPFLQVKKDEVMSNDSLQKFFRSVQEWVKYAVQQLLLIKTVDERVSFLTYMRTYISTNLFEDDILELHETLRSNPQLIENCELWGSGMSATRYCKWPTQNDEFDGFMGHLFFPIQLELGFETSEYLCALPRIQDMLAHSAQHGHCLSQYFLLKAIAEYTASITPESTSDDTQSDAADVRLPQSLTEQFELACTNDDQPRPFFFTSLLCLELSKFSLQHAFLRKAADQNEAIALYMYLGAGCPAHERDHYLAKLRSIHEGYAHLLEADTDRSLTLDAQIALYKKVGESGLPIGFVNAAALFERQQKKEDAYTYYLKAAREHILSAYNKAARLIMEDDCVHLFVEKGRRGDPEGYCQAGQIILSHDPNGAKALFEIDPFFGYTYLCAASPSASETESIQANHIMRVQSRLKKLSKIAGLHEY